MTTGSQGHGPPAIEAIRRARWRLGPTTWLRVTLALFVIPLVLRADTSLGSRAALVITLLAWVAQRLARADVATEYVGRERTFRPYPLPFGPLAAAWWVGPAWFLVEWANGPTQNPVFVATWALCQVLVVVFIRRRCRLTISSDGMSLRLPVAVDEPVGPVTPPSLTAHVNTKQFVVQLGGVLLLVVVPLLWPYGLYLIPLVVGAKLVLEEGLLIESSHPWSDIRVLATEGGHRPVLMNASGQCWKLGVLLHGAPSNDQALAAIAARGSDDARSTVVERMRAFVEGEIQRTTRVTAEARDPHDGEALAAAALLVRVSVDRPTAFGVGDVVFVRNRDRTWELAFDSKGALIGRIGRKWTPGRAPTDLRSIRYPERVTPTAVELAFPGTTSLLERDPLRFALIPSGIALMILASAIALVER